LLACACRVPQRIPNAGYLSTVSYVEQFLQGNSWLRSNNLFVEKTQPFWEEGVAPLGRADWNIVLGMERNLVHMIELIGHFLRPVSLEVLLKILNPIGHSWNIAQEEDEGEDLPVTCTEVTDLQPLKLGPIDP